MYEWVKVVHLYNKMRLIPDEMSTFDKLVEQREIRGISQREMAKKLGCTSSTLNRYESGNRKISAEMQDEYSKILGFELKLMVK